MVFDEMRTGGGLFSSVWHLQRRLDYIMDTFPIVKRKDEAKYGSYRTKEKILEIYEKMSAAIANGKAYVTALDPPPAHTSMAHRG